MSAFPDCRNDDVYNEDFLSHKDKEFIAGFDYCLEQIKNLIENNLDTYEDELTDTAEDLGEFVPEDEVFSTRDDLFEIIEENRELLSTIISHWTEMDRDELIVSMLENMDEAEFNKNRNHILTLNDAKTGDDKKEYYNTLKYACTGVKERRPLEDIDLGTSDDQ